MDKKQRDGGPGNNRHNFEDQCEDMDVEFIGETEGDLWLKNFRNDQSMEASSHSLTSPTIDPPRATSLCSASRSPRTAPPKIASSARASTSQGATRQRCIGCGAQIAKGSTYFDVVDEQTEDGVEIGWCFTCTIISGLNTGRSHQLYTNSQPIERPNQAAPDVEVGRQVRISNKQRTKKTGDLDAKNLVTGVGSKKRARADTTPTQHSHAQDVISSSVKLRSKPISSSITTSLGFGLKAGVEDSKTRGSIPHTSIPKSAYLNEDNPVLLQPPKAPAIPGTQKFGSTDAKRSRRDQSETQTCKTGTVAARSKYQIIHHHGTEAKEGIGRGKGGSTDGGTVTSRQEKSKSNQDASTKARSVDGLPQFHVGTSSAPKRKGRSGFVIKSYDRRSMKVSNSQDSRIDKRSMKASKSQNTKIERRSMKASNSQDVKIDGRSMKASKSQDAKIDKRNMKASKCQDSRTERRSMKASESQDAKIDGRSMKASKSQDAKIERRSMKASKSQDAKVKSGSSSHLLVVVDGSNVAFGFAEVVSKPQFSLKGILLALQYFEERGVDVVALVPRYRINSIQPHHEHHAALVKVMSRGLISVVPQKTDDDLFILSYATPRSAYVVTNDQFRDHMRTPSTLESLGLKKHEFEKFLEKHLVPYTFVRGEFTPNPISPIIKELTRKATTKGSEVGGVRLKLQASISTDAPEGTDANPIVISPSP